MIRVFIMSSERSGSNLLRQMLGSHEDGFAPVAIHFTTNMAGLSTYYHEGSDYRSDLLVTDMLTLARSHIVPWQYNIDIEQVVKSVEKKSFWGVMISLYDVIARSSNSKFWVCKDNAIFDYAEEIIKQFPEAKFIYLVRDGRDVALSFLNVPGGPKSITDAGHLWVSEQKKCLHIYGLYPENMYMIRYEDLLNNPRQSVLAMCDFLGITYSDDMMNFFKQDNSAFEKSIYWSNLNKPLMSENSGKWKIKMSDSDIYYYQNIESGECKKLLASFGYEVLEGGNNMIIYTIFRRAVDKILKLYRFFYYRIYQLEAKARLPKKRALKKIRKQLISRAG